MQKTKKVDLENLFRGAKVFLEEDTYIYEAKTPSVSEFFNDLSLLELPDANKLKKIGLDWGMGKNGPYLILKSHVIYPIGDFKNIQDRKSKPAEPAKLTVGEYKKEGVKYMVVQSQTGGLYAKRYNNSTGKYEYDKGAIYNLSSTDKVKERKISIIEEGLYKKGDKKYKIILSKYGKLYVKEYDPETKKYQYDENSEALYTLTPTDKVKKKEKIVAVDAKLLKIKEDGVYTLNGDVYKVKYAYHGSGMLYATKFNPETKKFEYVPGAVKKLSTENKMTLEEAVKFGELYGICARCGIILTNDTSIEAGIGPICRSYFS